MRTFSHLVDKKIQGLSLSPPYAALQAGQFPASHILAACGSFTLKNLGVKDSSVCFTIFIISPADSFYNCY